MMQDRTYLGKISNAEFGYIRDSVYLFGLQLTFKFDNSGIGDGGKYTVNISDNCKWGTQKREYAIEEMTDFIASILKDAKVDYVSGLVGKPVEIYLNGNVFKDFRILKEVL